ncbi:UDP-glucose 4-epimerase [Candidatus Arsenophonus lipoptenae]|uniref:UDP-glucose 4-epimerase n=1 Tax=Candidatus Arsenophonus lipoptenae TaxID=634113 RepID=A0A109QB16_9GAMM|nr:polysaccharide biosynthesis protein [Candidatus Arsenophonus lipoptenae]AMA64736.1 UDP-glucose 4-epimerase [Candidatus Arsenophonus lipoptenae]
MLNSKKLLITGGTGSFGNAILKRFLKTDITEIRIFSRDEKKQDKMRRKYKNNKLKFYIGDIRDYQSLSNAIKDVDYIFHAAALKQVPSCEFYPIEAVKTNILGTENVIESGINNKVKRIICLSTDKAVYPINAMGISKAMMEKIILAKARNLSKSSTVICATRYGNVMASRGSVIPLFVNQILKNKPISVTNLEMTRFMMTIEDAVDLVMHAFSKGKNGDIFVQKTPAATIEVLVKAITELMNKPKHPINIIGFRHGEKLFETLLTREEMSYAEDQDNYYRIPLDNRNLNYSNFFKTKEKKITEITDYNSHNTTKLLIDDIKKLLLKLKFFKKIISSNIATLEY